VYCPDVTPPKRPILLEGAGGNKIITLRWLESLDQDLDHYLIYQTDTLETTRDLRLMILRLRIAKSTTATLQPGQVAPAPVIDESGNPLVRRLQIEDVVSPNVTYHYRLVAVDVNGNRSEPSAVVSGRAYQQPPDPPIWLGASRVGETVHLIWAYPTDGTHPADPELVFLVERRPITGGFWVSVSGWLPPAIYEYDDSPSDPNASWEYRLRVRDHLGQVAAVLPTMALETL
jgi:hypothetical protein